MKLTIRQAISIMSGLTALFFGAVYAAGWMMSLEKIQHGHSTAPWWAGPTLFSTVVVGAASMFALIGMFVYFSEITKGES